MPNNILIIGSPRIGKTTLVKRLLKDLTPLVVRGFYKESIIENNILKGYSIITLDLKWQILAHIDIEGPDRIEDIGVNVDGFEQLVLPHLSLFTGTELFIIDEIGKMECFSQLFITRVRSLLDSPTPVLATVAQKGAGFISEVKSRSDVALIQITVENRDQLPQQLSRMIFGETN